MPAGASFRRGRFTLLRQERNEHSRFPYGLSIPDTQPSRIDSFGNEHLPDFLSAKLCKSVEAILGNLHGGEIPVEKRLILFRDGC